MAIDAEKFYTKRRQLLKFTINVLNYLPALRELWRKNLQLRPGMKILDVGCGTGAVTKTLYEVSRQTQAAPIKFCAFDLTQSLLDNFQDWIVKNRLSNIEALKADVCYADRQLPHHWQYFDLICSSGVLEYLNEKELFRVLRALYRLLAPHGKLVVMGSRQHLVNYFLIKLLYQANIHSKERFAELLREAGFREINFWKFPKPYSYLNLWGYIAVAEK